ncbi:MAG: glycerate kinase [Bacteroidales bacterium]|nr:glycerate kinase [Bacteroidales bacterium]
MTADLKNYRLLAEEIFLAGINAVHPSKLIRKFIKQSDGGLIINDISLNIPGKIYVTGAGKASGAMAEAVEEVLGDHISEGHVIVKYGHSRPLKRIRITEAGHPEPDHNGFAGTMALVEIAKKAAADDLLICLMSGGGSSLLADSPEGASEEDMILMNNLLVKCGASITEINTVRKHLSNVKGGKLAGIAFPATLVNLILSDVPGDDPGVIASGPTTPDSTTFADAMAIIEKYGLRDKFPHTLLSHLEKGIHGIIPGNPADGDIIFEKVHNIIIGNNSSALAASAAKADELGFETFIHENSVFTDVETASKQIIEKTLSYRNDVSCGKPRCILFGGETTLAVKGKGKGGRNQHLAMLCAKLLRRHPGITVLCGGTDGTDGPTHAAGAVVDNNTWTGAVLNRIDPEYYLGNFDSYNFFREAGGHIITGPTFTNVMDMVVVLISE